MKRNGLIKLLSERVTIDHWNRISNESLIEIGAKGWDVFEIEPHNVIADSTDQLITIEDVFTHVKPEIAPTIDFSESEQMVKWLGVNVAVGSWNELTTNMLPDDVQYYGWRVEDGDVYILT